MDFLTYRSRALSGLSLIPVKQRPLWSKDELEDWIKQEYLRHYPKKEKQCRKKTSG
jgi:hypothetical protein